MNGGKYFWYVQLADNKLEHASNKDTAISIISKAQSKVATSKIYVYPIGWIFGKAGKCNAYG